MKANGREPKSCLGRVFNFKLGLIHARLSLELKTRPRFRPVSLSLSMASVMFPINDETSFKCPFAARTALKKFLGQTLELILISMLVPLTSF
jgi:hypothetical protein